MIKEIVLNGKRIEYDLQRKDVKNINLRIKADRTIFLSANPRVSQEVIEEFIESKSEYILKALAHYEELAKYAPKPKQYVDGETFRVLGHDRRLKVIEHKTNNQQKHHANRLHLRLRSALDQYLASLSRIRRLRLGEHVGKYWKRANARDLRIVGCERRASLRSKRTQANGTRASSQK